MSESRPLNEQIGEAVAAFMDQLTPDTAQIVSGSFEKLAASAVAAHA